MEQGSFDFSNRYELGALIASQGNHAVLSARERSLGSPCFFHRITASESIGIGEAQATMAVLRRYCRLGGARIPRLAEGWISGNAIVFIEYRPESQPLSLADNNPFGFTRGFRRFELIDSMITLLAEIHRAGIVHGDVRPEAFGLAPRHRLHLIDTGFVRAVNRALGEGQTAMSFSLADNLSARDLAQLTVVIATLLLNRPLLRNAPDDHWDVVDFREATKGLEEAFPKPDIQQFFRRCLDGFGDGMPTYSSAIEAHKYWSTNQIGRDLL